MKKLCIALTAVMLLVFAGSAFAHCHGGRDRGGHYWRQDGNGGYYCDGGYGHGSGCRY